MSGRVAALALAPVLAALWLADRREPAAQEAHA